MPTRPTSIWLSCAVLLALLSACPVATEPVDDAGNHVSADAALPTDAGSHADAHQPSDAGTAPSDAGTADAAPLPDGSAQPDASPLADASVPTDASVANDAAEPTDANGPIDAGPLTLTPTALRTSINTTHTFQAAGGAGGYAFSFISNNSRGTLDSATGEYRSGAEGGVSDVIRVQDANGATVDATIEVKETIYMGVVYFASLNVNTDRTELNRIIQDIGSGATQHEGVDYDVQLVIHTDLSWGITEPMRGQFDFSAYIAFAELIRELNLTWAPLLTYHYVPDWVVGEAISQYGSDPRMMTASSEPVGGFMPFSPSSPVWSVFTRDWTVRAMETLAPYFGELIPAVYCGNEMLHDLNQPTSFDAYTLAAWRTHTGNPSATLPMGLASDEAFQVFRAQQWKNAIEVNVLAAKEVAQGRVKVSTKLVPYEITSTRLLRTGTFPAVYELLDSLDVIGTDHYPPNDTLLHVFHREDKPQHLTEFNTPDNGATGDDVLAWLQLGIQHHNVRLATLFSWNGAPWVATDDQKRGMRDAIAWITGISRIPRKTGRIHFQMSRYALSQDADGAWGIHPDVAARMEGPARLASTLGRKSSAAYELDHRPAQDAQLRLIHVTGTMQIADTNTPAIYLLQDLGASVFITSLGGSVNTATVGGDSTGTLARATANLASGTQVFGWTPAWNGGSRALATTLAHQVYVQAPPNVPVVIRIGNAFFIGQDPLWTLTMAPQLPLATLIGDLASELGVQ